MHKLEVLRAIHAGGRARDLEAGDNFEIFLAVVDRLEAEGLLEDVHRFRKPSASLVLSARANLTGRGLSYIEAMDD